MNISLNLRQRIDSNFSMHSTDKRIIAIDEANIDRQRQSYWLRGLQQISSFSCKFAHRRIHAIGCNILKAINYFRPLPLLWLRSGINLLKRSNVFLVLGNPHFSAALLLFVLIFPVNLLWLLDHVEVLLDMVCRNHFVGVSNMVWLRCLWRGVEQLPISSIKLLI